MLNQTMNEPDAIMRRVARKARTQGRCDCFAFPAMHDSADVCVNWDAHNGHPCTDGGHDFSFRFTIR